MKIGGLCFGYGGLDLAVQSVIPDAELAWYAEFDKGASKIGAHHWPDIPNHGDMTKIDWAAIEPVDILTGGTPCQDLSHAGKRAGMTEGTRSNLWVAMREAIATIRPGLVVWENVGGAFSAAADSEVEPCAGCVGDGTGVHLRALGRVLGDLSALGYDASWHSLRAADVGAPHGRLRVFVVAHPASDKGRFKHRDGGATAAHPRGLRRGAGWATGPREAAGGWASADVAGRGNTPLLGTPRASEWKGSGPVGSKSHVHRLDRNYLDAQVLSLLPTPTVMDAKASGGSSASDVTLTVATVRTAMGTQPNERLIPTPSGVADATGGHERRGGTRGDELLLKGIAKENAWGQYADAIHHWETLTRPAPAPTELGPKGNPRLSAAFSEWMMGLPAGWVADVPGITRNEALKALGNGVVPQQAAAALREMFAWEAAA